MYFILILHKETNKGFIYINKFSVTHKYIYTEYTIYFV